MHSYLLGSREIYFGKNKNSEIVFIRRFESVLYSLIVREIERKINAYNYIKVTFLK